jgi:hypothetical protein
MENRKVLCVTFPRSGHGVLAKLLKAYFQDKFRYCEYYRCCHRIPCVHPETNFQKIHDFQLKVENNPSNFYIVQYRHPLESITSLYRKSLERGWYDIKEDTKEEWIRFFKREIIFWKKFINKWVINNHNPNTYYLRYNELIAQTAIKLKEVIVFINPEITIELSRIEKIVAEIGMGVKNRIEDFKYFNKREFQEMEDVVHKELQTLSLKTLF